MQPKAIKGWLLPSSRATMIVTLIERDNIGGLAREIDLLKDLHVPASTKSPCKLGRQQSNQQSRGESQEGVLQIFDNPCKTTDVIANMVVEKVFATNCSNKSSRARYCFLLISNISNECWFSNILLISNSFADHPTRYWTLHPDYRRELQVMLSQYYEEVSGCKGARGVATPYFVGGVREHRAFSALTEQWRWPRRWWRLSPATAIPCPGSRAGCRGRRSGGNPFPPSPSWGAKTGSAVKTSWYLGISFQSRHVKRYPRDIQMYPKGQKFINRIDTLSSCPRNNPGISLDAGYLSNPIPKLIQKVNQIPKKKKSK